MRYLVAAIAAGQEKQRALSCDNIRVLNTIGLPEASHA
jgi:hypothetical protein